MGTFVEKPSPEGGLIHQNSISVEKRHPEPRVVHPFYPTNAPSPPPESGVAADGAGAGDVVGLDVFLEHGHAAVARHQADVEHIHACKVH